MTTAKGNLLLSGDCLEVLKTLKDNSVDAVVTDPPYGLGDEPDIVEVMRDWVDHGYHEVKSKKGFMGKTWDAFVPQPVVWREVFRVLKPGGHILVACGTRTQDWMTASLRFAGFEVRDVIAWLYGCLSDDTEILTEFGFMQYSRIRISNNIRILAYDKHTDTYEYEQPEKWSEYNVTDTCFRIQSDCTDQIVSRNHRCLIEHEGKLLFEFAEVLAQECEAVIPVLENVPELWETISDIHEGTGDAKHDLQRNMPSGFSKQDDERKSEAAGRPERADGKLRRLFKAFLGPRCVAEESKIAHLFTKMQRFFKRTGVESPRAQRSHSLETRIRKSLSRTNDWRDESGVERRGDLSNEKRVLRAGETEICEMPERIHPYVQNGRLCAGIQTESCNGNRASTPSNGMCASHRPQSDEQRFSESGSVCIEPGSQTARSGKSYKTTLARITPFTYSGIIFCPTVSTGAFVARRNGKIFITGNSGFPKSLDVSKAIDKAAGAEREVVGISANGCGNTEESIHKVESDGFAASRSPVFNITAPATDAAKAWDGWGTALKPAMELWTLARKPLSENTVAANVLKWGTGGLNIDGCRANGEKTGWGGAAGFKEWGSGLAKDQEERPAEGRFPANLIHDGSDEVVGLFPITGDSSIRKDTTNRTAEDNFFKGKGRKKSSGNINDGIGSAARFFYCAKASKSERGEGNVHPTVKPLALMRYLCRLITPEWGTILDPFAGSGTTGAAAIAEDFGVILIEREAEYLPIIEKRLNDAENAA